MTSTNYFKLIIVALLAFTLVFAGCQSVTQPVTPSDDTSKVTSVKDLQLTQSELTDLGLVGDTAGCSFESQEMSEYSTRGEYSMCTYYVGDKNGSQIITELSLLADYGNLNGSFQYNSGHLQGAKGIISLNTFGDQSRFSRNSYDDYGAEFNKDNTTYYHLWFTKDLYLVHVTSKGVVSDKDYVESIGRQILSKFE